MPNFFGSLRSKSPLMRFLNPFQRSLAASRCCSEGATHPSHVPLRRWRRQSRASLAARVSSAPRPCGFSLSKADRCSPACGDGEMLPVRVGLSPVTGPTAFAVAQASGRQRHRQRRARLLARSADLSLNARLHQSPSSSIAGHAPAVLFTRRSATRCHGQRGLAD